MFMLSWAVSESGYEIIAVPWRSGETMEFIRPLAPPVRRNIRIPRDVHREFIRPLAPPDSPRKNSSESHGLHQVFADLSKTREAIIGFANKYGLLGLEHLHTRTSYMEAWLAAGHSPEEPAEAVGWWIAHMVSLASILRAHDDGKRMFGRSVVSVMNSALRHYPATPFLRKRERDKHGDEAIELDFEPTSLIGAIYLAAARELASLRRKRVCPGCGDTFWVEYADRADKRYCSPACRVAAYRKRKSAVSPADS